MAHDVQAIGAQVSNLVKEAERLEETYPGARAKGVSERQVSFLLTILLPILFSLLFFF